MECLRTRVRFPPAPPKQYPKQSKEVLRNPPSLALRVFSCPIEFIIIQQNPRLSGGLWCMYGPDAFCKLFVVIGNGLHACIRLACGQLPKHARSLDEIRAPYPEQISGLKFNQPAPKAGFRMLVLPISSSRVRATQTCAG